MGGDRQHAIILPVVRSSKLFTNCNPIPRDAPLITNTALGSEFLLSSPLLLLLLLSNCISGKTGWPCDVGGSGASNDAAISDDDDDEDDACRQVVLLVAATGCCS